MILLLESPRACSQGVLLWGWKRMSAVSLGSGVTLQFVQLDLLCSMDPAQLCWRLPCFTPVLRLWAPKFFRRCQSSASNTYERSSL